MEMSEKKFYLDQAKKLKDNFNNKYPDYVYRRRPNNSRKKRKPDAEAQSPTEQSVGGDTDDASVDDPSPVDPEDQSRDPHSAPYLYRPSSGTAGMYEGGDSFLSSQATPSYPYVADIPPAQYGQTPRLSHPDQHQPQGSLTPLRIPSLAETVANAQGQGLPYSAARGSASQATITSPVHAAQHSPQAYWDARHGGRPEDGRTGWPALDLSVSPARGHLRARGRARRRPRRRAAPAAPRARTTRARRSRRSPRRSSRRSRPCSAPRTPRRPRRRRTRAARQSTMRARTRTAARRRAGRRTTSRTAARRSGRSTRVPRTRRSSAPCPRCSLCRRTRCRRRAAPLPRRPAQAHTRPTCHIGIGPGTKDAELHVRLSYGHPRSFLV